MAGRRFLNFHKKNYRNPFFKRSKSGFRYLKDSQKNKMRLLRKRIFLVLFLATAAGWVWFLFYSPYFEIKKIEIFGLEKISESEIKEIIQSQIANYRFLIFRQKNIFWFDEKLAEKNINSKYVLTSLKINKKLPETIEIILEEKKPALIWKTGEKFYYADWNGIIIHELSQDEVSTVLNQKVMPLVYDENNQTLEIKNEILTSQLVQFIVNLNNNLSKETTNLVIEGFKVVNKPNTIIKALANNGWQIYFTGSQDLDSQIKKLNLFLKENKEEKNIQEYIDLRFEDRVYYK